MNHVSGAWTRTISRSSANSSSTLRAASTSRISGIRYGLARSEVGDRAGFRALRQLRVLGEEAARVARLGQLPVLAARRKLGVVDHEIDRVRLGIDHDPIAVGDER